MVEDPHAAVSVESREQQFRLDIARLCGDASGRWLGTRTGHSRTVRPRSSTAASSPAGRSFKDLLGPLMVPEDEVARWLTLHDEIMELKRPLDAQAGRGGAPAVDLLQQSQERRPVAPRGGDDGSWLPPRSSL